MLVFYHGHERRAYRQVWRYWPRWREDSIHHSVNKFTERIKLTDFHSGSFKTMLVIPCTFNIIVKGRTISPGKGILSEVDASINIPLIVESYN